jgi:hypothetical protein
MARLGPYYERFRVTSTFDLAATSWPQRHYKDGAYISYTLGRFSPGRHLDDQSSLREIPRRAALVDTLMVPVSERENDGRKRIDISGP